MHACVRVLAGVLLLKKYHIVVKEKTKKGLWLGGGVSHQLCYFLIVAKLVTYPPQGPTWRWPDKLAPQGGSSTGPPQAKGPPQAPGCRGGALAKEPVGTATFFERF